MEPISKTAQLLYRLIANRTTRVVDALGIPTADMTPADIEWLYNSIGKAWKMEQDARDRIDVRVEKGECLHPYDYDVVTGEWHKRTVVLRQKGE